MTPDELDQILSLDPRLEPPSGFARQVMASIHREADAPPPLRFPWWRFGAGVAASGGIAAGATVLLSQADVFTASVPPAAAATVYAFAMLLVGIGVAAAPRVFSKP